MKKLLLVMSSIIAPLSAISVVACKGKDNSAELLSTKKQLSDAQKKLLQEEGNIRILGRTIQTQEGTIRGLNGQITELEERFDNKMIDLEELEQTIEDLRTSVSENDDIIQTHLDTIKTKEQRIATLENEELFIDFQENIRLCTSLLAANSATLPEGKNDMQKILIRATKAFYDSSSLSDKRHAANRFKTAFDAWILENDKTAQLALIGKKMIYADELLNIINNFCIHTSIENTAHKTRLEKDYVDNWYKSKWISNTPTKIDGIITYLENSIKTTQDYLNTL